MNSWQQTVSDFKYVFKNSGNALKKFASWKNLFIFIAFPILFSLFFWIGLKPPFAQPQDIAVIYLLIIIFAAIAVLTVNFKKFQKFIFFQILPYLIIFSEVINFELYTQFYAENAIRYGFTIALLGLMVDFGTSLILNIWKLNRCSAILSALWQIVLAAPFTGMLARNVFGNSKLELDTVTAIYQTDFTEAVSYCMAHWSILFAIIFLIMLAGTVCFLYLKLQGFKFTDNLIFKIVISIACLILSYGGIAGLHKLYRKNKLYLFSLLHKGWSFRQELVIFNQQSAQRRLVALTPDESRKIISNGSNGRFILILGESNNRNYMKCYGYKRDTTPFLNRMKNDPRFTFFERVYSNHVHTTESLKYLLSEQNQYNGRTTPGVTIFDVARYCKYKSSFISNQYVYDNFRSPVSAICQAADEINYLNTEMDFIVRKNRLDIETVNTLKNLPVNEREIIVIHLMSCHAPYQVRYPNEFRNDLPLHYERAIAYLDYILEELFSYAMKDDSITGIIFVPDHGEDVVKKDHDSANFTPDMTRIPMICYLSNRYVKENPQLQKKLKLASKKVFTNDLVFDFLLDVMGIENRFNPQNLHLLSDEYNLDMQSARTLHGRIKLEKNKN